MRLIPCFKGEGALSAPKSANLLFSNIVRLVGILKMVLHDHDSTFTSNFWKTLWESSGTKVFFTLQVPTIHRQMVRLKEVVETLYN